MNMVDQPLQAMTMFKRPHSSAKSSFSPGLGINCLRFKASLSSLPVHTYVLLGVPLFLRGRCFRLFPAKMMHRARQAYIEEESQVSLPQPACFIAPGYSQMPARLEYLRKSSVQSGNGRLTAMAEKQDVDMGVDLANIRKTISFFSSGVSH